LNASLWNSIEERRESGGMIYTRGGNCFAMPPRALTDPTRVDAGQREPNCGCPSGTTPIAYYHTHPTYSVAGLKAHYKEFRAQSNFRKLPSSVPAYAASSL